MTTEYAEDTTRVDEHYTEINGRELHVVGGTDDVEVWLNTEVMDFDGICIGGGESRRAAVADAIETMERALGILKEQIK